MPEETPPAVDGGAAGGESPSQQTPAAPAAESTAPVTDKPAEGAPVAPAADKPAEGKPAEGTPAPAKLDEDLDAWAKARGYELTTDNERKIAQDARNQQREFRNPKDAVAALDKTIAKAAAKTEAPADPDADPVETRMAKLEAATQAERDNRLRSEYLIAKKVTPEESAAMSAVLEERIAKATTPAKAQAALEYLTDPDNLDIWHDAAKARIAAGTNPDAAVEAAKVAERERLAKTSNANGPTRAATSTAPAKPETDHERQLRIWGTPAK